MTDPDLIAFLRWALPRLGLHWPGFRKVRGRVRKRLNARPREPGLPDVAAYQDHLEAYPGEWAILDGLCRITVTRFHRDRGLFDRLRRVVLPEPAQRAWDRGTEAVRCWSAGCASGEESYTLKILRELGLPERPDGGPTWWPRPRLLGWPSRPGGRGVRCRYTGLAPNVSARAGWPPEVRWRSCNALAL
jgi:chemotaxis protein methyltransferase CheR